MKSSYFVTFFWTAVMSLSFANYIQATGNNDRLNLKFQPQPGTLFTYLLQTKLNMEGKDFLAKEIWMGISANGNASVLTISSSSDTIRLAITTPGIMVNVTTPESTLVGTIRTQPSQPLEMTLNSSGNIVSTKNFESLEQDFHSNISFAQILFDYFPLLPIQPVSPGDIWRDKRYIRIPYQGIDIVIILETEYKLEGVLLSKEDPKAYITTSYKASAYGEKLFNKALVVFRGDGGGSGFIHFLPSKGILSTYELTFRLEGAVEVKLPSQTITSWPFSFFVSSFVSLGGVRFQK